MTLSIIAHKTRHPALRHSDRALLCSVSLMLIVMYKTFCAECRNAECHYAECRYAECRYVECRYAECRYSECRYAEYRSPDLAPQSQAI